MKNNNGSRIVKILILSLIIIMALLVLNPSALFFLSPDQQAAMQSFVNANFSQLPASIASMNLNIGMVFSSLLMFGLLYVIYQVIALIIGWIPCRTGRQQTLNKVFLSALRYALVILGIIWALMILGVDTSAIFASVGIAALVVSLSAESLFADMFTGVFILLEDQYKEGDIISIDGFRGTVISLGIRTTKIEDTGGNVKIINNADIRNVMNLSNKVSYSVCDISMAYDESIERAEAVIADTLPKIMEKYPHIFPVMPEYAGVQSLSASSVDLRVMAKVDEANIYAGRRILNRELKLAFDANNIEIPFPQMVLHKADS